MFINLSNHPSDKFTSDQMSSAREYGEVVDFSFPSISPEASASEVAKLASDTLSEIVNKWRNDCVIHVMGEQTFCFSFIKKAQQAGIRCLASTTERRVVENSDGSKTSLFRFVAFRDYL